MILSRARTSMAEGNYTAAFDENSEVLSRFPLTYGDRALLQMGILFAHPDNPGKDYDKSVAFFQRLLREFPRSKAREESLVWIMLIQETARKEKEIAELRGRIDEQRAATEEERRKADLMEGSLKESREKTASLTRQVSELQKELDNLKNQIEELKKVDLGTEERKRKTIP